MEFEEFSFEPALKQREEYEYSQNHLQSDNYKTYQISIQQPQTNQYQEQQQQYYGEVDQNHSNNYFNQRRGGEYNHEDINQDNHHQLIDIENDHTFHSQNGSSTNLQCFSSNKLIPYHNAERNHKSSSNTLCTENFIPSDNNNNNNNNNNNKHLLSLNTTAHSIEPIACDDDNNQNDYQIGQQAIFNDDSSSIGNLEEQNQICVQKIKKFKYPDMKYETTQLNYRENYYLVGDLFISVNMYLEGSKENRHHRSSIWNQIRPVNLIENRNGYLSIVVDDSTAALEDFDRIIALLNKLYSSHAGKVAQWLIKYQQYLRDLEKTRSKIFDQYSHNISLINQKLAQNTLISIQQSEQILDQQYDSENNYLIYTYRRTNSDTLTQTLYKGGMSRAMLKLIYISEEKFRIETLRYGMLELFTYEGYEQVNYSYIFGNTESQPNKGNRQFNLFTYDDFEVQLEMEEFSHPLSKVALTESSWFGDQLRVYKFSVTPEQLFQLQVMRKELSSLDSGELYKHTEYYQQSEDFLKKFYSTQPQTIKKIKKQTL